MISGIGSGSGSNQNNIQNLFAKDQFVSQNTFMELLITQLKNQDPMNPQDSSQFVSQLAQFSSLEQMTQLNKNISSVLETSVTNLIGRTVTVADSSAPNGFLQGTVSGIVYYANGPTVRINGNDYQLADVQNVF
jgi:flagellar basal-body rod modification protein FlgD